MNRVFIDMDGVIVDFDGFCQLHAITPNQAKDRHEAYWEMKPIPGALEAVREVMEMGYEVFIATKPPTGVDGSYRDKARWIFEHLPELKRHLIITPDKGLLGDSGDFLCDDRPHKANCEEFQGTLLRFENGYHWPDALKELRKHAPRFKGVNSFG